MTVADWMWIFTTPCSQHSQSSLLRDISLKKKKWVKNHRHQATIQNSAKKYHFAIFCPISHIIDVFVLSIRAKYHLETHIFLHTSTWLSIKSSADEKKFKHKTEKAKTRERYSNSIYIFSSPCQHFFLFSFFQHWTAFDGIFCVSEDCEVDGVRP